MDCCSDKKSVFEKIRALMKSDSDKKKSALLKTRKVALIGNPNVGKSVIFNSLTGAYVTVSNYPGTTVEVSRGWYVAEEVRYEIIDTPGMYSMVPITDEERVTRRLLINERPDLVVHVIDAKNIERMLPLTLQLMEAGFNTVLVLNIFDEAKALGIEIDSKELRRALGIPVVCASAALNEGLFEVKKVIEEQIRDAA